MFREELALDVDLHVVPMKGWRRKMAYEDTGLPWVLPSEHPDRWTPRFVYPGGCLVEGTNLSEAAGTTRPFEARGGALLDGHALARALDRERIPGAGFRAAAFTPDLYQKPRGRDVPPGVQVHVFDPAAAYPPFLAYLLLIHHARRQDPSASPGATLLRVRVREAGRSTSSAAPTGSGRRSRRASRRSGSPGVEEGVGSVPEAAAEVPALLRR